MGGMLKQGSKEFLLPTEYSAHYESIEEDEIKIGFSSVNKSLIGIHAIRQIKASNDI
jgi:hypothetical protein